MVRETVVTDMQSICQGIEEVAAGWRAVLARYASGELDDGALRVELEGLVRRLELLANALWATLETGAIHVLVPSETLGRWAQDPPTERPAVPDALDALDQATAQLRAARCLRRTRSRGEVHLQHGC